MLLGGVGYSHLMEQSFEESYSRGTSMDVNSFQHVSALKSVISPIGSSTMLAASAKIMVGFSGWVELDRAVPRCYGAFDFFISDEPDNNSHGGSGPRKIVQWRCAEIDDEEDNAASGGAAGSRKSTSFLSSNGNNKTGAGGGILRKCNISRIAWNDMMFQAALAKLKPCPLYVPGEGGDNSSNSPGFKK
jgi:hypothetical protein